MYICKSRSLRAVAMEGFANYLQENPINSAIDKEFQEIISATVRDWSLHIDEFCDEFGVSRGTVSRWINGKSAPHPMARERVITWVIQYLKSEADDLRAPPESDEAPRLSMAM